MIRDIDNFYLEKAEPNSSCLLALRAIVLEQDENVREALKWGMPCFLYKNKMFCFLMVDKKTDEPYILFVEGNHLDHPLLEIGTRKRMKILRINPHHDLPMDTLDFLLNKALDFYRK